MPIGWKVLSEDGSAVHGGTGKWPLPKKKKGGSWTPGAWVKESGPLELCRPGTLHLCRSTRQLVDWLGPAVFHCEYRGEVLVGDNKIGVLEARLLARNEHWDEVTARLFAADCADSVVHLARTDTPQDAIRVARRYAFGLADNEELTAALAAAWDAAWDTAWDASSSAAGDAAVAAARAAAGDAAGDAAVAAARAAARAAAGPAARAAAWAAAWDSQVTRLHAYLTGQVDLEAIRQSVL